jgi:hypothetical protein
MDQKSQLFYRRGENYVRKVFLEEAMQAKNLGIFLPNEGEWHHIWRDERKYKLCPSVVYSER